MREISAIVGLNKGSMCLRHLTFHDQFSNLIYCNAYIIYDDLDYQLTIMGELQTHFTNLHSQKQNDNIATRSSPFIL
jgi:hypothetical protein